MSSREWCPLVPIFIITCGCLANAATDTGVTPAPHVTTGGSPPPLDTNRVDLSRIGDSELVTTEFRTTDGPGASSSSAEAGVTPTPDDTSEIYSSSATHPPQDTPGGNSSSNGTGEWVTPVITTSEPPTAVLEASSSTAVQPILPSEGCVCDVTPGFCDIGCCCDNFDCGIANLSTVFTECPQTDIPGVCIEKWLMFKANVDSSLVTETDSFFCIRTEEAENPRQPLPALPLPPALGDSYRFSPSAPTRIRHSRPFYRVDDVIQTYFYNTAGRGLLRQPSPGPASTFCMNRNPAKFLRSESLSCTRMLTRRSCTADPALNARSYFTNMSLIKIPIPETDPVSDDVIPVTSFPEWPAGPREENNSCVDVVKEVEFVIGYTGRGEITNASVTFVLADVDLKGSLAQIHSVRFQLEPPQPAPGGVSPAVGLRAGSPVLGRSDGDVEPLTVPGGSEGGECSSDLGRRAPVLFTHNSISGCTFSSSSGNCSELRSQIYRVFQGNATADVIAMNMGSDPDWTRVLNQECPFKLQETNDSACILPTSLSVQILWARQGLLDLPQNFILGAKYLYKCQKLKCPMTSPITLVTEVTFADTTLYPESPRGSPQPNWKFPFGFFTGGRSELDGYIVVSGAKRVTWRLMLLSVMSLTGLEFFCR